MIKCYNHECSKNNSELLCECDDVIIKPLTMPHESGEGEIVLGFVCTFGTGEHYDKLLQDVG